MKKILYLIVAFLAGISPVDAQVAIGSQENPHAGAVLDLSQPDVYQRLGLLLPNVRLDKDLTIFKLPLATGGSDEKMKAKGMLVYNTNPTVGEGFYVWDGSKWKGLTIPTVTSMSISGLNTMAEGKMNLSAVIQPSGASGGSVSWEIVSLSPEIKTASFDAEYSNPTWFYASLSLGKVSGTVVIRATVRDGSQEFSAEKTISVTGFEYNDFGDKGVWMTENLKGDCAYCNYLGIYFTPDEAKNACPPGWSLPTEAQWTNLLTYLISQGSSVDKNLFLGSIYGDIRTKMDGKCAVTGENPKGTVIEPRSGFWWTKDISRYAVVTLCPKDIWPSCETFAISDYPDPGTPPNTVYPYFAIRCIKD